MICSEILFDLPGKKQTASVCSSPSSSFPGPPSSSNPNKSVEHTRDIAVSPPLSEIESPSARERPGGSYSVLFGPEHGGNHVIAANELPSFVYTYRRLLRPLSYTYPPPPRYTLSLTIGRSRWTFLQIWSSLPALISFSCLFLELALAFHGRPVTAIILLFPSSG